MSAPLISDTALWANCARTVADLMRDIAAQEVLPRWQSVRFDFKADGSLLSEADTAVQQALARTLFDIYPAPLLGEESPTEEQSTLWNLSDKPNTTLWIADPIDGTTNFVSGLPWYAISVALVHQSQTVVGVTYAPSLGNLWHASLGGGAFCNDQPVLLPQAVRPLRSSLIGVDMTFLPAYLRAAIAHCSPSGLSRDSDQSAPWRGWRSLGASTLEWCALASGQIQAYVHGGQMLWDAAAGRLILAEAGGHSTTLEQIMQPLSNPSTAATRLGPVGYAAAAPGVWQDWQSWLRAQLG
jgi:fructose-1,6-bisphosphatase/inositol monophosphatase family enzyme